MPAIRIKDLTGRALDAAVALSIGGTNLHNDGCGTWWVVLDGESRALSTGWAREMCFAPSVRWEYGGPLIERFGIDVMLRYGSLPPNHTHDIWDALIKPAFYAAGRPESGVTKEIIASGPYPLTAAMRCIVRSVFGDEVTLPENIR